jgi:hypothetical protein
VPQDPARPVPTLRDMLADLLVYFFGAIILVVIGGWVFASWAGRARADLPNGVIADCAANPRQ